MRGLRVRETDHDQSTIFSYVSPEQLLRTLLLQALYSIRSERMLMEQLEYNLLFRWLVGLEMDDRVWDVTVFTKNRNGLVVASETTLAMGTAEREASVKMTKPRFAPADGDFPQPARTPRCRERAGTESRRGCSPSPS
jgi:hypothetical protein